MGMVKRIRRRLARMIGGNVPEFRQDGHFYSPLTNIDEVKADIDRIWPSPPQAVGIDFNDSGQRELLQSAFAQFGPDFDYPLDEVDETTYYENNDQYIGLDPRALFVLLRHYRPRRMIEIGSGYSSLLTADVNKRYVDGKIEFTCIEPYPREFLKRGIPGITGLIEDRVQAVPMARFEALEAGDILFIDSSHVAKTGSDVNHIYFEILPRLKPGVLIHIHDIFLPEDYLKRWVLEDGRCWNEQYLVQALLMYSHGFEIVFACRYASLKFPELIMATFGAPHSGGSLWIRKLT